MPFDSRFFLVTALNPCLAVSAAGTVFAKSALKFRPLAVGFNGQIRKATPFSLDSAYRGVWGCCASGAGGKRWGGRPQPPSQTGHNSLFQPIIAGLIVMAESTLKGVLLRIWPLNPTANGRNFDADLAKMVPAAETQRPLQAVTRKTAASRAIKRH